MNTFDTVKYKDLVYYKVATIFLNQASQVVLMVNNLPASVGDIKDGV